MRTLMACLTTCMALGIATIASAGTEALPGNLLPVVVDSFAPGGNRTNLPTVKVTLCVPDHPDQCQTIDHILVDTGATGLRIYREALNPELQDSFPAETVTRVSDTVTDREGISHPGAPVSYQVAECLQYVKSSVWGSVTKADVWLGSKPGDVLAEGHKALHRVIPVQLIGAADVPKAPADCTRYSESRGEAQYPAEQTIAEFGSNGTIGVSTALMDNSTYYYICTVDGDCKQDGTEVDAENHVVAVIDQAHRVANPVYMMPADNNGVIFQLDAIANHAAASANGQLILGINTEENNKLDLNREIMATGSSGTMKSVTAQKETSPESATFFRNVALDTGCQAVFLGYVPGYDNWSIVDLGDMDLTFSTKPFGKPVVKSRKYVQSVINKPDDPDNAAYDAEAAIISWSKEGTMGLPFFFGKTVYVGFESPDVAEVSMGPAGTQGLNLFPDQKIKFFHTPIMRRADGPITYPFYSVSP